MIDLQAFVTQPLVILAAALALFIGRTVLHARHLKSLAKDPELAKLVYPAEGRDVLGMHKESLNYAKGQTTENLASARTILQDYKRSKQRKH